MTLIINGKKTGGILENMIVTTVFYLPNVLFLIFDFFKDNYHLLLIYNWCIMFLLFSVISYLKYNAKNHEKNKKYINDFSNNIK